MERIVPQAFRYKHKGDQNTMKSELIYMFVDIDGCLVKSFDGKGLNQAAFAEQCKQQPLNKSIVEKVRDTFSRAHIIEIATGRKQSVYEDHTKMQLGQLYQQYIENIFWYPESFGYEPLEQYINWKVDTLKARIHEYLPSKIIVVEDDWRVIQTIHKMWCYIPMEFWIVVKDQLLLIVPRENLEMYP
jgi:hypothetical protein